jgi:hypothetical protein
VSRVSRGQSLKGTADILNDFLEPRYPRTAWTSITHTGSPLDTRRGVTTLGGNCRLGFWTKERAPVGQTPARTEGNRQNDDAPPISKPTAPWFAAQPDRLFRSPSPAPGAQRLVERSRTCKCRFRPVVAGEVRDLEPGRFHYLHRDPARPQCARPPVCPLLARLLIGLVRG